MRDAEAPGAEGSADREGGGPGGVYDRLGRHGDIRGGLQELFQRETVAVLTAVWFCGGRKRAVMKR